MVSLIILVLLNLGLSNTVPPPSINLMTFNIRYDNPQDGINKWDNRKSAVIGLIGNYQPDIFGIQEGLINQVKFFKDQLPKYKFIGVGREDGKKKGEYSAIFYRTDRFKLLNGSTFWLSDKPETPSKGWDAALERICTYALFQDSLSARKFWVFNTHFDHEGVKARENSAILIIRKISELKKQYDYSIIIMGDLNATEDTEPIRLLRNEFADSREVSRNTPVSPRGTFNGFKFNTPTTERIDYIFVEKKGIDVMEYQIITDSSDDRYPSDHFPVFIKFCFI